MEEKNKQGLLRLNLQHFAEGGEGDPEETPTPPNDPEETPPTNPEDDKTFTQAELDDIIAKRLARDREKFSDYDELKTQLSEFKKAKKEAEEADMSELEKLQAKLAEKEAAELTLTEKLEAEKERGKKQSINNEFIKLATNNEIAYVDAAFKLADLSEVEVDEHGKVTGVDKVIESLIEDNPFLVKKEEKKPKQIGGGTNLPEEGNEKTSEQLLEDAANKYKQSGKQEDMAAYSILKRKLGL